MIEPINEHESKAIARRLTVIRHHVSGDNQAAFARSLGISPNRWNNFERGFPLNMQIAMLLCKRVPGITVSYITHGLTGDLTVNLQRQLAELELKLFSRRSGKRS